MPEGYRLTLRLTPDLYAQLQARGSHGQTLAAILREALIDYLARQPPRQPWQTTWQPWQTTWQPSGRIWRA